MKNQAIKSDNCLLVIITVLGSAGPIRFIVHEGKLVAAVIETALKSYAREGRLPMLGSNLNDFEAIEAIGVRNFMLCKKP
ncbi:hypothetical protein LOK49_LG09G01449 [Camellia lanceoleosa]|uniref:Uncharacterized protein n=1 Tax=Camellia lanceoleosa TaxID=1840588 RepID=A0ACC0GH52_9ERIC|nr:hypothetical protein LOK49_LG09G01449 [Camellia lanceoleosa]